MTTARPAFDYDGPACAEYSRIGLSIRDQVPIVGETATNAECEARSGAVLAQLVTFGLPTGTAAHPRRLEGVGDPSRTWYTTEHADGIAHGQWADSAGEAIIETAMWWGVEVVRVHRDPDGTLHAAAHAGRESVEVTLW